MVLTRVSAARYQLDGRGPRRRADNGVDDIDRVAAVFAAVHGIELVVEFGSGVYGSRVRLVLNL